MIMTILNKKTNLWYAGFGFENSKTVVKWSPNQPMIVNSQEYNATITDILDSEKNFRLTDFEIFPIQSKLMAMNLCEQNHLILKPNQLYIFTVDEKCEKCKDLEKKGKPHSG